MSNVIQYPSGMSNGFFVVDEGGVIAVDGGAQYGKEFAVKACADAGIDPKSIRLIVVSHPHVDHTCNVDELRKISGAPIVVQKAGEEDMITAERPHVFPRNPIGDEIMEFAKKQGGMPDDYLPPITPDLTWEESFDLHPYGVAGKLIHTPGHSLADCCVILESGQAIIGDLVCQDGFTHGKPTVAYFGYTPDRKVANAMLLPSLDKLLAEGSTVFYSGHGGPYTREQVEEAVREAKEQDANL